MDDLFSDDDRERIAEAIDAAEAATSAGIVPYVAVQSGVCPAARWRGGVLGALLVASAAALLRTGLLPGLTPYLTDLSVPAAALGVSLVMEVGCLRYIFFGMGWLCAICHGLLTGAIGGEGVPALTFLTKPIAHVFVWGYPIAAYWGHRKPQSMPEERYWAWDQTLTGGALLGFGAGSIAGLFRSVGSGFGGFGGKLWGRRGLGLLEWRLRDRARRRRGVIV
ncbi:MAG: hypothetical protein ABEL51_16180 [Salinibacter sp.]